jgi:hypothetical protein
LEAKVGRTFSFFGTKEYPLTPGLSKADVAQKYPDLASFVGQYASVYNFIGHGAKNQLGDVPKVRDELEMLVKSNNNVYGEGKWLAVYGGDNANTAKPDIGAVMQMLGQLGVHVLAVQCAHYAGYIVDKNGALDQTSYGFLKAAVVYTTEYKPDGSTTPLTAAKPGMFVTCCCSFVGSRSFLRYDVISVATEFMVRCTRVR